MAEEKKTTAKPATPGATKAALAAPKPATAKKTKTRRTTTAAPAGSALGNAVRVAAALVPVAVAGVSNTLGLAHTPPQQTAATTTHVSQSAGVPMPLVATNHPVNWWFVFKLNGAAFPKCGGGDIRTCPFGGPPGGAKKEQDFGQ